MKNFFELRNDIQQARKEIVANLIELMKKHNCKKADSTFFDSTPIIIEGSMNSDETFTMDAMYLTNNNTEIRVECSCAYTNDDFDVSILPTDLLLDLWEWVIENEDDFFDKDNIETLD